jgi:hypothetical protein
MDYEVMRLAKQAGVVVEPIKPEALARFAELVAAQEREACAKICEFGITIKHPTVEGVNIHQFGRSPELAAAIRSRTFGD